MIQNLYSDTQDVRKRKLDQIFFDPFFFTTAVSSNGLLERPRDEQPVAPVRETCVEVVAEAPRRRAARPKAEQSMTPDLGRVPPPIERAPDILGLAEAAAYLRLSPNRVRSLARTGALPVARVGRSMLFRRAALLAWVRSKE